MDSTIRDLFRSLELTLQERLRTIEDVIRAGGHHPSNPNAITVEERLRRLEGAVESFQASHFPGIGDAILQFRVELDNLRRDITEIRRSDATRGPVASNPLIPHNPLEGLEVIPKREVAIPVTPPAAGLSMEDRLLLNKKAREAMEANAVTEEGAMSAEDRLLLNKKARKALEAEEMGEGLEEHAELDENEIVDSDIEGDGEEGLTEEVEVEVEEEGLAEETEDVEAEEAEEAESEAEELELEEFEYKGSTYYRDGENNVYMMDEEGELQQEPIGVWNEAKQRIVVKKSASA